MAKQESSDRVVGASIARILETAGPDIRELLESLPMENVDAFERLEQIGDEYCWMHTPGGWTCQECRAGSVEVR